MSIPKNSPIEGTFHFLTSWEMLVVQGISVAIVAFSPDDVLTRYSILAGFVAAVAEWIPAVRAYQRVSEFPQVSGLYFSVMFFITPLILLYSFRRRGVLLESMVAAYEKRPIRYCILAVPACAFFLSMPLVSYIFVNGKNEWFPSMPMRSSKLSLAILGWLAAGGSAWSAISCVMLVIILFSGKLQKIKPRN